MKTYPPPPSGVFIDREYVLQRGEQTDYGCRYPSAAGEYPAERIVEADEAHCLHIVSRGVFVGAPPGSRVVIKTFNVRVDSMKTRSDTARRDTQRRKP